MTLSKRGDYVVRSALCLARAYASGEHRKIREVVAEMGVPHTFASQILAELVRAGLATSRAGREGGYRLSRPPEEITVVEVVEAGEGPLQAERCALGEGPCRWDAVCPLHDTWQAATGALRAALAGTSLAALAAEDSALEAGTRVPPDDSHRHVAASIPVHDTVQVEQAVADVVDRLRREAWVAARIVDAYAVADDARAEADPGGLPWSTGSPPAVRVARRESVIGGRSVDQPVFDLAWELDFPGGATSRLEGTLTLQSADPERTEVEVSGRFRVPGRPGDPAPDEELAERLARRAVRAFVRALADGLERGGDRQHDRATA
ncbi:MAG: Rrf2 family transcriptional regulator [Actinomycetota bacterium]|jgi:Rrf2 family protein|nr:Rrf2 family transcriptional regulator [Actinomycetota bacterium]MDA8281157.1 Rrf2 family transcriptional regulator [Actinomycetota bacterium]